MAVTAGLTGNNQSPASSFETLYSRENHGGVISTLMVKNRSASANEVHIRIPELHGSSGFATLQPGESEPFRVGDGLITSVQVKSDGATIDWYGVATTKQ